MKLIFMVSLLTSSCIIPRKYQKDKPFVTKNHIEVKGGKFTKDERTSLKQRLNAQLDDSSKIKVVDKYFIRHIYNSPAAYDSGSAIRCDGPRVELLLNGESTVTYTETDPTVAPDGLIALQIHGNCKAEIAFRNLEIEERP